jgi:hypothetical protein
LGKWTRKNRRSGERKKGRKYGSQDERETRVNYKRRQKKLPEIKNERRK